MNANDLIAPLFTSDGSLRRDAFEPSAMQLLEATQEWLKNSDRTMFLPIDVLLILIQQREPTICSTVQRLVHGQQQIAAIEEQLRGLIEKVDKGDEGNAELHVSSFSLGFSGMLADAWAWTQASERTCINYQDIVRAIRLRAEVQDSASVRWALRKLIQPSNDRIFDSSGLLLEPLFSPTVLRYLNQGVQMSTRAGLPFLGTPHLVASICSQRRSVLWRAAQSAAIDPLYVRDELMRIVGKHQPELPAFKLSRRTLTPRVARILLLAHTQAKLDGHLVEEHDLLNAFLEDGGSSLELLRALGVAERLRNRLMQQPSQIIHNPARMRVGKFSRGGAAEKEEENALESVGVDLMVEAAAGRLPVVLGRDDELERIIRVLMRTEQRNPVLTGRPGVGKTALAQALASAIHQGNVPTMLKEMRVIEISGAALMGGTSFRGELEERIANILKEAEGDIILFIDEAHAVFAPTANGGRPAEVPNHFKAALASGKIAVIAATTDNEYRRWFEADPALARRFERIAIEELPTVVTQRILQELRVDWQSRYGVRIPDGAVDTTIELSQRFLPELSQPDKAKKLLMDAAIATSIASSKDQPDLADDESELPEVTRQIIAEVLSSKTGVPVSRILRNRSLWWQGLEKRLDDRVPNQGRVAAVLTQELLSHRIGSRTSGKHAHSLLFAGPSSPAKEEFAHALAEELFGTSDNFFKLDMSDYQDGHSISRLLGSPPGYVGYEDQDALVAPLRQRPAQVVYLADFHLCHPQIRDRILRMLDDGEITDMHGMRADCTHALFVMAIDLQDQKIVGFGNQDLHQQTLAKLPPQLSQRVQGGTVRLVAFQSSDKLEAGEPMTQWFNDELERIQIDFEESYGMVLSWTEEKYQQLLLQAGSCASTAEIHELLYTELITAAIAMMIEGEQDLNGLMIRSLNEPSSLDEPIPPHRKSLDDIIHADS